LQDALAVPVIDPAQAAVAAALAAFSRPMVGRDG